jgi:hypothetical protein
MSTEAIPVAQARSAQKLRDAVILISVFAAGAACCWQFRLPWVVANFLLMGLPLAYLLLTSERARKRVSPKFTALFVVFAVVAFDYMCERYEGWGGPTAFSFRLPGGVTLEEVQWIVFFFPLTFAINEHFFATEVRTPPNRAARLILKSSFYAGLLAVAALALSVKTIPHVYVRVGLVLQPFFILLGVWVNRWVVREVLWIGLVTGLLNLVFEFLALRNNYWSFPGTYIGRVRLLGFEFPVEELLFLILFSGPSIVCTYAIYKNWKQI